VLRVCNRFTAGIITCTRQTPSFVIYNWFLASIQGTVEVRIVNSELTPGLSATTLWQSWYTGHPRDEWKTEEGSYSAHPGVWQTPSFVIYNWFQRTVEVRIINSKLTPGLSATTLWQSWYTGHLRHEWKTEEGSQSAHPGVFDLKKDWKTEEKIYLPQWPSWFFLSVEALWYIQYIWKTWYMTAMVAILMFGTMDHWTNDDALHN
jgi:hypothetical protein